MCVVSLLYGASAPRHHGRVIAEATNVVSFAAYPSSQSGVAPKFCHHPSGVCSHEPGCHWWWATAVWAEGAHRLTCPVECWVCAGCIFAEIQVGPVFQVIPCKVITWWIVQIMSIVKDCMRTTSNFSSIDDFVGFSPSITVILGEINQMFVVFTQNLTQVWIWDVVSMPGCVQGLCHPW